MPAGETELPADISPSDPTSAVSGIGKGYQSDLAKNGYNDVQDLQNASVAELSQVLPTNVAQDVKGIVGDAEKIVTTAAEAKAQAQKVPGAIAKVVRVNGQQVPKVLEKIGEKHEAGATIEIHKG